MRDLMKTLIERSPQITASVVAAVVLFGGGIAIGKYQEILKQQEVKQNIADAKEYLQARSQIKDQLKAVNFTQLVKNNSIESALQVKTCDKLEEVADKVDSTEGFAASQYAGNQEVIRSAQDARDKYTLKQTEKDIRNLHNVCLRQASQVQFDEAMQLARQQLPANSVEFYKETTKLMQTHAEELAKSCPYAYLAETGQQICDHQVQQVEKNLQAEKLKLEAVQSDQSLASVAEQVNELEREANRPLDDSIYEQVLDEETSADNFVASYVAVISERFDWL